MDGFEFFFNALFGVLLMRRAADKERADHGPLAWLTRRMWNIMTLRPWPRTVHHFGWMAGSRTIMAKDVVKYDIQDGHKRADEAIARHKTRQTGRKGFGLRK